MFNIPSSRLRFTSLNLTVQGLDFPVHCSEPLRSQRRAFKALESQVHRKPGDTRIAARRADCRSIDVLKGCPRGASDGARKGVAAKASHVVGTLSCRATSRFVHPKFAVSSRQSFFVQGPVVSIFDGNAWHARTFNLFPQVEATRIGAETPAVPPVSAR